MTSRRRYRFAFVAVPRFVQADVESGRLRRGDLAIVATLIRLARDGELSGTDARLAALCGVAESSFKAALRRLRLAGRVVARTVRAAVRRVLVLPWLAPPPPPTGPVQGTLFALDGEGSGAGATRAACKPDPGGQLNWGAENPAPEGPRIRPPDPIPPTPPLCESPKEDDDKAAVAAESSSSEAAPPGGEAPPAAPDPLPALMARAEEVWRPDPSLAPAIARAAAEASPELVSAALEICRRKARREPVGVGFLFGVLKNLVRQGGAPPRPRQLTTEERVAKERAERERDRAPSPAEETPPTAAEVAEWREWAAVGDRVRKGIAVRSLARWGIAP